MRQFVKSVEEKALGVKVLKGVRPDQQLVKVVNDQLIELMGGQQEDLNDPKDGPQVCTFSQRSGMLASSHVTMLAPLASHYGITDSSVYCCVKQALEPLQLSSAQRQPSSIRACHLSAAILVRTL